MPDMNDYCARCGRSNTCHRSCHYITDFNGFHIPDYRDEYDSDSSDEELTYLEELIEYVIYMKENVTT